MAALEQTIAVAPLSDLHGDVLRYETLIATAGDADIAEYRKRAAEISASQLLTIIYTSGTTGEPKGVMLTHSNVSSNVVDSLEAYDFSPEDLALSFLPLAHIYERTVDYGYLFRGVPIAYVEQMEAVPQAFLEVKPTCAAAVPRFFEKIYASILDKGRRETGLKRKVFDWSLRVAQESIPVASVRQESFGLDKTTLANCRPHGVFEDSRRSGRKNSVFFLWWRAAGTGAFRIFLVGEFAGLAGLRADGDLAGGRFERAQEI